jgi:hypothetical protein
VSSGRCSRPSSSASGKAGGSRPRQRSALPVFRSERVPVCVRLQWLWLRWARPSGRVKGVAIRIAGSPSDGGSTPYDGQYISYLATETRGFGGATVRAVATVDDPQDAYLFDNVEQAAQCWMQAAKDGTCPLVGMFRVELVAIFDDG